MVGVGVSLLSWRYRRKQHKLNTPEDKAAESEWFGPQGDKQSAFDKKPFAVTENLEELIQMGPAHQAHASLS